MVEAMALGGAGQLDLPDAARRNEPEYRCACHPTPTALRLPADQMIKWQ
jgi:hypothetical protein